MKEVDFLTFFKKSYFYSHLKEHQTLCLLTYSDLKSDFKIKRNTFFKLKNWDLTLKFEYIPFRLVKYLPRRLILTKFTPDQWNITILYPTLKWWNIIGRIQKIVSYHWYVVIGLFPIWPMGSHHFQRMKRYSRKRNYRRLNSKKRIWTRKMWLTNNVIRGANSNLLVMVKSFRLNWF